MNKKTCRKKPLCSKDWLRSRPLIAERLRGFLKDYTAIIYSIRKTCRDRQQHLSD